jgi:diphthine-ammonia ligase
MPRTNPCAWSTSGGKDSLLALWYAKQQGRCVTTMLTMFDETGLRSRSHGIELPLMRAQARSLGMDLFTPHAGWRDYETVFVEALLNLRASGHEAVIFGDIDLLPHREWEEKVCARTGLNALLPLWQRNRRELAEESLRLGFKSIVVCVDHRHLARDFAGRLYDESFLADLPDNVDACGENGEFHTFVYDGPLFNEPLSVEVAAIEDYQAPAEFGGGWYSFARLRERDG